LTEWHIRQGRALISFNILDKILLSGHISGLGLEVIVQEEFHLLKILNVIIQVSTEAAIDRLGPTVVTTFIEWDTGGTGPVAFRIPGPERVRNIIGILDLCALHIKWPPEPVSRLSDILCNIHDRLSNMENKRVYGR
jgi:hypothetical protein